MQKILVILGIILLVIGLTWPWISSLPIGRLPGDIIIKRENFTFYFPITTMIILSLLVTAILWMFRR